MAGLGKRLTMSQLSRHTRYELTWSEIAILGLLGMGCCVWCALRRHRAAVSGRHPR